ncbi:hypothetical protein Taro_037894 [Colocasia esculenta]|uniref:DNA topoisomerase n=1 Tax=Colocasia esculenta TaxID=4460 RepID=A0A843W6S4_COLES|nr:hypothetical protein [Colocasia esculenta]
MSSRGGGVIRVLNVAEKPSVAKSVAEILSRSGGGFLRSRVGRSRYNRVFEFDYAIRGQPCHMLMTSVTGHLMELDFDDRYRRWHSCDPADLYHAPVRKYVPQVVSTPIFFAEEFSGLVAVIRAPDALVAQCFDAQLSGGGCFCIGLLEVEMGLFWSQNRADFPLGRGKGLSSGLDPSYPFSKVSLTWENGISMSAGCCNGLTCELCVGKSGTFLDKLDIKSTLEIEVRSCQWLVLWLDCDTEGENIAFEVLEVCTTVNQHLNIWRARFSALIDREIHQSVQNLVRPNKLLADAVDVRQEIDLRIGASFTRFQTMLLKDAFILGILEDDRNLVLSYGSCQFPTLGFIVERYWEIQAHEPEEFWTINCSHTSDDGTAIFNWMYSLRGRLFDYTCSVILYEMCVEQPTATVKNVRHQEKLKYPPFPLSTVELQKRASRYFRMSSERTMKGLVWHGANLQLGLPFQISGSETHW